jgi:hypothetical protein
VQLYRTGTSYLLDFHLSDGDILSFLYKCKEIMNELVNYKFTF